MPRRTRRWPLMVLAIVMLLGLAYAGAARSPGRWKPA